MDDSINLITIPQVLQSIPEEWLNLIQISELEAFVYIPDQRYALVENTFLHLV